MLTWYDPLYVGPKAERQVGKIRKRLDKGKTDPGHYLVTLAANGTDELDIINSGFLTWKNVYNHLPMVMGVGADRAEALDIAGRIIEDCLHSTGGTDVRAFIRRTHIDAPES